MLSPELGWLVTCLRGAVPKSCGRAAWCWHLGTALTVPLSCQATELLEAILEGYPKSKKQFFVSTEAGLALWPQGGSGSSAYTARLGQLPC